MAKHLTVPLKLAVSPVVCVSVRGVTIHPVTQVEVVLSLTSRCIQHPVQSASYSDLFMPLECLRPLKDNMLPPEKAPVLVRPLCFSLFSRYLALLALYWAPAGPCFLQSWGPSCL